jgi:molybdopterin-containing oxidoreductase family membrane subunit
MVVFLLPVSKDVRWLSFACILSVVGIWIEKGMGFVVPGFLPTPLGEIVEYTPSFNEILVTVGIWGLGLLVFTILVRISLPVLQGHEQEAPAVITSHAVAVGV